MCLVRNWNLLKTRVKFVKKTSAWLIPLQIKWKFKLCSPHACSNVSVTKCQLNSYQFFCAVLALNIFCSNRLQKFMKTLMDLPVLSDCIKQERNQCNFPAHYIGFSFNRKRWDEAATRKYFFFKLFDSIHEKWICVNRIEFA